MGGTRSVNMGGCVASKEKGFKRTCYNEDLKTVRDTYDGGDIDVNYVGELTNSEGDPMSGHTAGIDSTALHDAVRKHVTQQYEDCEPYAEIPNNGECPGIVAYLATICHADVNIPQIQRGGVDDTPLLTAIASGHPANLEMTKLLLSLNARVDLVDRDQCAPLARVCGMPAESPNNIEIVQALIEAKADVNPNPCIREGRPAEEGTPLYPNRTEDSTGYVSDGKCTNPLINAATQGSVEIVRILIEAGAVLLKNAEGTPVQEIIDTKLWEDGRHELVMESLIKEMLVLNPKTTEEQLRQGLKFGKIADSQFGLLEGWNLEGCNLEALPESFGNVRIKHGSGLQLNNNQLQTVPESFRFVTTNYLDLSNNQLGPTLPESFQYVQVRKQINLAGNNLTTFPNLDQCKRVITRLEESSDDDYVD